MGISITYSKPMLKVKILSGGDWDGDLAKIKSFKGSRYIGAEKLWSIPETFLYDILDKWPAHERTY